MIGDDFMNDVHMGGHCAFPKTELYQLVCPFFLTSAKVQLLFNLLSFLLHGSRSQW